MNDAWLRRRRVLITGAGSGIGRALAERVIFAGSDATLIDLNAEALAAVATLCDCVSHAMDVADPDAWTRLPRPEQSWDFVALNAGVMTAPPDAPREALDIVQMDLRSYHRVMRVNVDGVVHGVRCVVPGLADGGAVVATASAAGLVGYAPDVAYGMSKHAVVGLVRGLAPSLDRKQQGQRVCAICPGGVRTGIVPAAFQGMPMMEPSVIAQEILDLWREGENGEVRIKMRVELPAQRIDEPELPPWW
jgi:NAD(P)-dependent dehydrogenase (short-subunit alcohol dehydrogenase family)